MTIDEKSIINRWKESKSKTAQVDATRTYGSTYLRVDVTKIFGTWFWEKFDIFGILEFLYVIY